MLNINPVFAMKIIFFLKSMFLFRQAHENKTVDNINKKQIFKIFILYNSEFCNQIIDEENLVISNKNAEIANTTTIV